MARIWYIIHGLLFEHISDKGFLQSTLCCCLHKLVFFLMYNLRAYVLLLKLLFECSLELQAIFIKHFFLFSVCLQDSTIGTHSKVSNKHNVDHFTMSSPHNTTHSQHNLLFKVFKRPFIMEGNSEGTALLCGLVLPFLSLNWKFGSLDQ